MGSKKEDLLQKNIELWAQGFPKEAIWLQNLEVTKLTGKKRSLENWVRDLHLEDVEVLYVYGVGLGEGYNALKRWLNEKRFRVVVFLEDQLDVIYHLFSTSIGTEILRDKKAFLHYFQDVGSKSNDFSLLHWKFLGKRLGFACDPRYLEIKGKRFDELRHKIAFDAVMRNGTVQEYLDYGASFFRNYYLNIQQLPRSFLGNSLFGKFRNVPAIICGAGPSLEKQLPLLREVSERAIIFAGGSAVNALNNAGLQPHFGAGVDPNSAQLSRLKNNSAHGVPFFYRNRMYHEAFLCIDGPRLYVTGSGGYDIADYFEERLKIPSQEITEGYNVINFSTEIARMIGCHPIIFVGLDLAFTGDKIYAPGIVEDVTLNVEVFSQKDMNDIPLQRPDIYGKPVWTLWKWIAESEWYGDFAKEHPEVKVINATEGGIGFPGIENRPFKKITKKYLTKNYRIHSRIKKAIESAHMPQVTKRKVLKAMRDLDQSLVRCIEIFDILLQEVETIKLRVMKDRTVSLHTGTTAICEADLADEPAFKYILQIFNQVHHRVSHRDFYSLSRGSKKPTLKTKLLKQLNVSEKRYAFLKKTAFVNRALISHALKKH